MRQLVFTLLAVILLGGCSVQKLAIRTTSGIFSYGIEAIYAEPDLPTAEIAVASNLKLLEGFYRADPGNKTLQLFLTQGFAAYSLAFLESEYPERASLFYLRARGVPEDEAKLLLVLAFLAEALDEIERGELVEDMQQRLRGWLERHSH